MSCGTRFTGVPAWVAALSSHARETAVRDVTRSSSCSIPRAPPAPGCFRNRLVTRIPARAGAACGLPGAIWCHARNNAALPCPAPLRDLCDSPGEEERLGGGRRAGDMRELCPDTRISPVRAVFRVKRFADTHEIGRILQRRVSAASKPDAFPLL